VERLRIHGGFRLTGEVSVSGGKNAALAIIPAALLADSPCTIENLPDIDDVHILMEMLTWLGADAVFEDGVMTIDPRPVNRFDPPYSLTSRMRASYYLVPVLLGRFGRANVPYPGGCDIGSRPIDLTIKALRALGAELDNQHGTLIASAGQMRGSEVFLDFPSVGATINAMLTAVNAPGATTIINAAKEPHVVDVANFLGSMGAYIKGAGTNVIRIRGGRPLSGSTYTIIPDQIETGTLMIAAAATGGDVTIRGAIPTHMESLSVKLLEMGVEVRDMDDVIQIRGGPLRPVNIKTQVYPGFPTDLQQPTTAMLSLVRGTSVVTETIFESRYRYIEELQRMGANIRVMDRTAMVEGVTRLTGAPVMASDLRAGAALIIAGLIAEGTTEIQGTQYIDRGYEHIEVKLRGLGARMERVNVPLGYNG